MKENVGSVDRTVRFIVGVVIAALGIYYQSWWGLLAVIPFFTAFTKSCMLYIPFGISTCKKEEAAE